MEQMSEKDKFLNNYIIPMYEWIEYRQQESGAIIDDYVQSELKFQYHVPYFILSSIILNQITNDEYYLRNAERSIQYLDQLGYNINKQSNSFIALALLITKFLNKDDYIDRAIENYLLEINFFPPLENMKKSANNFYALKGLAHLLQAYFISNPLTSNDLKCGKKIINTHLMNWQLSDGIFYDKPFELESTDYVPHLTYHATMMMVMAFSGRILFNERMMESANNALITLMALTSPAGEAFGYGRSNHAIFGYVNAILGCTLLSDFYSDGREEINIYRNLLCRYIIKHRHVDGHLFIVPNNLEGKRAGFDSYMFVTVYESYALAMLLLSHLILPLHLGESKNLA